jgi:hypothetical protein
VCAFVLSNNILNLFIARDNPSMMRRIEENVSMRISITLVRRVVKGQRVNVFRKSGRLRPESVGSVVVAGQDEQRGNLKK